MFNSFIKTQFINIIIIQVVKVIPKKEKGDLTNNINLFSKIIKISISEDWTWVTYRILIIYYHLATKGNAFFGSLYFYEV